MHPLNFAEPLFIGKSKLKATFHFFAFDRRPLFYQAHGTHSTSHLKSKFSKKRKTNLTTTLPLSKIKKKQKHSHFPFKLSFKLCNLFIKIKHSHNHTNSFLLLQTLQPSLIKRLQSYLREWSGSGKCKCKWECLF